MADELGGAAFEADRERGAITGALLASTADLVGESDVQPLLARFSDALVASSPHLRLAWFYVGDPDADVIRPLYAAGPERQYGQQLEVTRSALMMRGPVRRAFGSREPIVQRIPQRLGAAARLWPGVADWHRRAGEAGVRSVLALPFRIVDTPESGVVVLYADREDYFDAVGMAPFTAFARLAQAGISRARGIERERAQRERIAELSLYDRLTGLPNRAMFRARLTQSLSYARQDHALLAVAMLDLEDFHDINEHFGYAAGDDVLCRAALRLREQAASESCIARLGGDQFGLIVEGTGEPGQGKTLVESALDVLREPVELGGGRIELQACAGLVIVDGGKDNSDADAVLTRMEAALGQAKAMAGPRVAVWSASAALGQNVARHTLAYELRRAIREDELTLYYQPQVSMGMGGEEPLVSGVEALLRWDHPTRGLLTPQAFIPVAEASSLIAELDQWALDRALRQAADWHRQGLEIRIGFNVSAAHLMAPTFIEHLEAVLKRYPDAQPRWLEIEVTETAALGDLDRAHTVLSRCRDLGVGVALDDFGTGYASLTYLQRLPATKVKIDREFTRRIDRSAQDVAIVAGVITAARLLDLDTVAEGVENEDQGAILARLGCALMQGYFLSQPMPASQVIEWSRSWHPPNAWHRWGGRGIEGRLLPVLAAELRHKAWARQLLEGGPEGRPASADLPRQCVFSNWMETQGPAEVGNRVALRRLDELHRRFHDEALRLSAGKSGVSARSAERFARVAEQLEQQFQAVLASSQPDAG